MQETPSTVLKTSGAGDCSAEFNLIATGTPVFVPLHPKPQISSAVCEIAGCGQPASCNGFPTATSLVRFLFELEWVGSFSVKNCPDC